MNELCPKCQTPKVNDFQCENCQLVFAKYNARIQLREYLSKFKTISPEQPTDLPTQDSRKIRTFAFPLAIIISFICLNSKIKFLFFYFSIWIHEFGHAMMSWISGIAATPLSFGLAGMTFTSGGERSLIVLSCFIFLNLIIHAQARKYKAPFASFIALPLIVLSVLSFIFLSNEKIDEFRIAAGFAGEIIISVIMILSFYFKMPWPKNWTYFLRWAFLLVGFFSLINATSNWLDAHKFKSLHHFGANFSEEGFLGAPGDLHRLVVEHEWTLSKFKKIYLGLAILSWLIIISSYAYFLSKIPKRT